MPHHGEAFGVFFYNVSTVATQYCIDTGYLNKIVHPWKLTLVIVLVLLVLVRSKMAIESAEDGKIEAEAKTSGGRPPLTSQKSVFRSWSTKGVRTPKVSTLPMRRSAKLEVIFGGSIGRDA